MLDFDAYLEQEYEDRVNGGLDVADPEIDPADDGGDWDDSPDCDGECEYCDAREDCEASGGYPDWSDEE